VVVKDGAKVHIIPVDRLDYAEAQDDYVSLHSLGKSHLKQQTISSLETALDPERFVRIHRSIIVNLERVRQLEISEDGGTDVILNSGTRLRLSRRYRKDLQAGLGLHDA